MKKIFIETDKYSAVVGENYDLDMYSFLKSILKDNDEDINDFLLSLNQSYKKNEKESIVVSAIGEPGRREQINNRSIFTENSILFKRENGKYVVHFGDGRESMSAVRYFVESKDNNGRWAQNQNAIDLIGDENVKKLFALYKAEKGEQFSEDDFDKESEIGKLFVALSQNEELSNSTNVVENTQIVQNDDNSLEVPYQKITSQQLIAYINSDEYEFPFSSKVLSDTALITAFRDDLMKKDLAELQAMLKKLKEKNELLRMKIRAENGDEVAQEQVAKIEATNAVAQEMRYNAQSGAYEQDMGATNINVNNEVQQTHNKNYNKENNMTNLQGMEKMSESQLEALGRGLSSGQNASKIPYQDDGGMALASIKADSLKNNVPIKEQATQKPKAHYPKR